MACPEAGRRVHYRENAAPPPRVGCLRGRLRAQAGKPLRTIFCRAGYSGNDVARVRPLNLQSRQSSGTATLDEMTYILDRFEDNDLAVLETDAGESVVVPRAVVPPEAREGDVLLELDASAIDGEVRYAVDFGATERRKQEIAELRASLPKAEEGDIEL